MHSLKAPAAFALICIGGYAHSESDPVAVETNAILQKQHLVTTTFPETLLINNSDPEAKLSLSLKVSEHGIVQNAIILGKTQNEDSAEPGCTWQIINGKLVCTTDIGSPPPPPTPGGGVDRIPAFLTYSSPIKKGEVVTGFSVEIYPNLPPSLKDAGDLDLGSIALEYTFTANGTPELLLKNNP